MDLVSSSDLRELISGGESPCVSIYMPAHKTGPETRGNPTRYKNLVREAQRQLDEEELDSERRRTIDGMMQSLIDDRTFWRSQSSGLAAFFSPERMRYFRLPESFREIVSVSRRFLIKPLLPHLAGWGRFYVLALSLGGMRLIRCFRYRSIDVTPEEMPRTFEEAMKYDDPEKHIQSHTGVSGKGSSKGSMNIFHGQGSGADERRHKKDILRFFHLVDDGVGKVLAEESVPLVLAGVDYLRALYREASSYRNLLDEGISGNPDRISEGELHDEAWQMVEPVLLEERNRAVEIFEHLQGTPRTATEIEKILPAAAYGQVASLFVAGDREIWGRFDEETGEVQTSGEQAAGTTDLLDLAAAHTLLTGGAVYVEDEEKIPGVSPISAVLRYPAETGETAGK